MTWAMVTFLSGVTIWIAAFFLFRSADRLHEATISELNRALKRARPILNGESFTLQPGESIVLEIDFPHVRLHPSCLICGAKKDGHGLLVCWKCYRSYHFRTGAPPSVIASLQRAEQELKEALSRGFVTHD
jgi:hypothetical protein